MSATCFAQSTPHNTDTRAKVQRLVQLFEVHSLNDEARGRNDNHAATVRETAHRAHADKAADNETTPLVVQKHNVSSNNTTTWKEPQTLPLETFDTIRSCQNHIQTLETKVDTLLSCQNDLHTLEKKVDALLRDTGQRPATKFEHLMIKYIHALKKKVDSLATEQNKVLKLLDTNKKQQKPNSAKKKLHPSLSRPNGQPASVRDMSSLLQLPAALQENITMFTRDLSFNDATGLPDLLQEKGCITSDDYERICAKSNPVDQVRLLILKIKDRGPQVIQTFLDVLNSMGAFAHLVELVNVSLKRIVEQNRNVPVCVVCVLKQTVDIKDIVDYLWKEHVVSDDMHGTIVEAESIYPHRACFWNEVIDSLNDIDDTNKALLILTEALDVKYKYINEYLARMSKERKISCICERRRSLRRRASVGYCGSESEYSTTSTFTSTLPRKHLFNSRTGSETDLYSETQSESHVSSFRNSSYRNFINRHSFDMLERYDSIGSFPSLSPQSPPNMMRERLRSREFVPQVHKMSELEEHQNSLEYISESTQIDQGGENERESETVAYASVLQYNTPDYKRSVSKISNRTTPGDLASSSFDSAYDTERQLTEISDDNHGYTDTPSPSVRSDKLRFENKTTTEERNANNVFPSNSNVFGDRNISNQTEQGEHAEEIKDVMSAPISTPMSMLQQVPRSKLMSVGDGVLADVDDDEYINNNRSAHKRRHKFTNRRLQLPTRVDKAVPTATKLLTPSKPCGVNASTKLANHKKLSRKRKQTMRRELRRKKAAREKDDGFTTANLQYLNHDPEDDPGLKHPYNPMMGKYPKPKLVPKWDYNQARRYWQMSHYMAPPPEGVAGNSISDTGFKTEDSDDSGSDYIM